ncbi:hypothetical protein KR222_000175 [Zaprionus bogoriensis]|nr:hypothetical protein KR222_000175 [Zaprionus bogoriensis]
MAAGSVAVGDWLPKGKLGQGGFGEVRHWVNRRTNQEIATKHIRDVNQMSADQERKMKERWMQEYRWTQDFQQQSCIVAGVRLGDDSEVFLSYLNKQHVWQLPVIILEYCNGGDVRKLLKQPHNANGLMELEVRQILRCLREAVHFLHTHGICHRDLKPDNIVMHRISAHRKQYKLTDFGLARNTPDQTMIQSVVGTRHYYAPEVVDSGKYNSTVDYWSIGVIAYELATGTLPFIPHQKTFNIHVNIRNKQRKHIAITEDIAEAERYHFHTDLPVVHHLSKPWAAELVKWLPLALDADYSQRGIGVATDEVQCASHAAPVIFTELDRLLDMKVLTLFAACSYQRIECPVRPEMTMPELAQLLAAETGLSIQFIYLVLPTGHPHKRITMNSRPLDLFVEQWCDNSEESGNPPVMVYIFSAMQQPQYLATEPCMTELVRHYFTNSSVPEPGSWVMERLILDLNYMLSKEREKVRMLLYGFREYAMTLEHEVLDYQPFIKQLEREKDKCCGALEQFLEVLESAKQQQKFHLLNNGEWEAKCTKLVVNSREILKSCEKTVEHFESSLRGIRDTALKQSTEIYHKHMNADIYELTQYRKTYLQSGVSLSLSDLYDVAKEKYAQVRHTFLQDENIKLMRDVLSQLHFRFYKVRSTQQTALNSLGDIRVHLKELQLEMLPSAVPVQPHSIFQLNNAMGQLSVAAVQNDSTACSGVFDSFSTRDIISEALRFSQL